MDPAPAYGGAPPLEGVTQSEIYLRRRGKAKRRLREPPPNTDALARAIRGKAHAAHHARMQFSIRVDPYHHCLCLYYPCRVHVNTTQERPARRPRRGPP